MPEEIAPEYLFPETVGACVDRAFKLRGKRLKLEAEAAALKAEETALKDHVIEKFSKSDIDGVKGKLATASVTKKTVAQVDDWDAFYAYIYAEAKMCEKKKQPIAGAFSMLHKRVSDGAYNERLEAHETVPGTKPFIVIGLSLTKR